MTGKVEESKLLGSCKNVMLLKTHASFIIQLRVFVFLIIGGFIRTLNDKLLVNLT